MFDINVEERDRHGQRREHRDGKIIKEGERGKKKRERKGGNAF